MKFSLLLFSAALLVVNGLAGEAAHAATGDSHGIPWGALGVQAFNVTVLVTILFFVLRKVAVAHFAGRAKDYTELVQRAEMAKVEAERGHREIKERLEKLEAGAEQSLVQARREAEELKVRMIDEARAVSERLQTEAQRTINTEIEKAKAELRHELLQSALATSHEVLKSSLSTTEQKKLQNEFVEKIQVVGG